MVVWHPQTGPGTVKTVTIQADGKLFESLSLPAPRAPGRHIKSWTTRALVLNSSRPLFHRHSSAG